ncbi:hypothetical protein FA15DRAFT_651449 [Coprinopsis marcescibilis]|uniref:Voltage-gated hydrogen channel 1 n=1 Tax=Coprinopsis marcescibilis TaxID=230819 RepID=A0A5C3LM99_COPMA|nr:hypothetical protein FA15DRAFT_651449 [Coprinopsis marcescibilis]
MQYWNSCKSTYTKVRDATASALRTNIFHICVILLRCDAHGHNEDPKWISILADVSLGITVTFVAEILLTLWALGFRHFNPFGTAPFAALHLFDAAIVLTTFIFEVVLRGGARELAGLLIVLRLWRLVKLAGGVAVLSGDLNEVRAEELQANKQELEKTKGELDECKKEITTLRQRLGTTTMV